MGVGRRIVLVHCRRRIRLRDDSAALLQRVENGLHRLPHFSGGAADALPHLCLRVSSGKTNGLRR